MRNLSTEFYIIVVLLIECGVDCWHWTIEMPPTVWKTSGFELRAVGLTGPFNRKRRTPVRPEFGALHWICSWVCVDQLELYKYTSSCSLFYAVHFSIRDIFTCIESDAILFPFNSTTVPCISFLLPSYFKISRIWIKVLFLDILYHLSRNLFFLCIYLYFLKSTKYSFE